MPRRGIANTAGKWYTIPMANSKQPEQCMVCGTALEYLQQAVDRECASCGKKFQGHIVCPEGHVVCDECHGKAALKAIKDIAFTTASQDPFEIAELMMGHPSLPMLGCEHAFVAAGAFMAALKNSPHGKGRITNKDIQEAFDRTAKQAVGGYCGLTGVCGIVPAVGACFSIFLGARCGSDREQKITMDAVIEAAKAVSGLTGPSCCKAYVRSALSAAVAFFGERFGIVLPAGDKPAVCSHSAKHPHGCREEKCPYFRKAADIFSGGGFVPGTVCTS